MTNQELHETLLAETEIELSSLVRQLDHLLEAERRMLNKDFGRESLFEYCRRDLKWCKSETSRKIGALRILKAVPEVRNGLIKGRLGMSQLTVVTQGINQKEREAKCTVADRQIKEIIFMIRDLEIPQVQEIVSKVLDIKIKKKPKIKKQKDGSVRAEMTFSKEFAQNIERLKQVMSHAMPGATEVDLIEFAVNFTLKQKDPSQEKRKYTAKPKDEPVQESAMPDGRPMPPASFKRTHIPASLRRDLFQRDECCQHEHNGEKCSSRFQLEPDHVIPIWQGGKTVLENLQLLCAKHNKQKYKEERGYTH